MARRNSLPPAGPTHTSAPDPPGDAGRLAGAAAIGLSVVPYQREQHEDGLVSLYARTLGKHVGAHRSAILAAMSDRMPGRDRGPVRLVVVDGKRVAGTLGYMPAEFLLRGERIPVRFTCDLLVDPSYAAAALRVRKTLGIMLAESARSAGEFLVGGMWMTGTSHRIHLAAGFDDAMTLPSYTLALRPQAFVARRGLPPHRAAAARCCLTALQAYALGSARVAAGARGLSVRAVERSDASLDDAWLRLARTYALTRVRDAAYLDWKYADHPRLRYRMLLVYRGSEPAGYMVWRLPTPDDECARAIVLDFLTARGDAGALRALVGRVVLDARAGGAESVSILTTQPWAAAALRYLGFLPRAARNTWVVAGWQNHIPPGWLHDPEPWHLCMGDSDGDLWSGILRGNPGLAAPLHRRETA